MGRRIPGTPIEGKYVPETVTSYLAKAGACSRMSVIDLDGVECIEYSMSIYRFHRGNPLTDKHIEDRSKLLPLALPGAEVIGSHRYGRGGEFGGIYFTWSREAMWQNIRECFEEHGVADTRVRYRQCSGRVVGYDKDPQGKLPLRQVKVEPRSRGGVGVWSGWTSYGLMQMDSGFAQRIMHPNRGGPEAYPFGNRRVECDGEWWLVGSRGDSLEVMELEIMGSPLDERTKENLLHNLHNFRK